MRPETLRGRLEDSPELSGVLHDLMTTQNFGVLCTQSQGQPYGSLMCFATSDAPQSETRSSSSICMQTIASLFS